MLDFNFYDLNDLIITSFFGKFLKNYYKNIIVIKKMISIYKNYIINFLKSIKINEY